jgi:hypothetical protein
LEFAIQCGFKLNEDGIDAVTYTCGVGLEPKMGPGSWSEIMGYGFLESETPLDLGPWTPGSWVPKSGPLQYSEWDMDIQPLCHCIDGPSRKIRSVPVPLSKFFRLRFLESGNRYRKRPSLVLSQKQKETDIVLSKFSDMPKQQITKI